MPPKPKFSKEEIINVALKIVSERGLDALTARELGKTLNSSARPIFTIFNNMEELIDEVKTAAMNKYISYKENISTEMPYFKQMGMKMVLFGLYEPKLYQLLFMQEFKNTNNFEDLFEHLGTDAKVSVEHICKDYQLDIESSKLLFENMWIYTYGIGTLCATKVCKFSEQKLSDLLSNEFNVLLKWIRRGDKM